MVSDILFPLLPSDIPDGAEILVPRMRFPVPVPVSPDLRVLLRRDGDDGDPVFLERIVALPGVVRAVAGTLTDGNIREAIEEDGQHLGIVDGVVRDFPDENVPGLFIRSDMEFEPCPALALAVLPNLPFAFTIDLDTGGIHDDMDSPGNGADADIDCERLATKGKGGIVGSFARRPEFREDLREETFRRSERQTEELTQGEGGLDGGITEFLRSPALLVPFGFFPLPDGFIRDMEDDPPSVHERLVVFLPIPHLVCLLFLLALLFLLLFGFRHMFFAFSLAKQQKIERENYSTKPSYIIIAISQ